MIIFKLIHKYKLCRLNILGKDENSEAGIDVSFKESYVVIWNGAKISRAVWCIFKGRRRVCYYKCCLGRKRRKCNYITYTVVGEFAFYKHVTQLNLHFIWHSRREMVVRHAESRPKLRGHHLTALSKIWHNVCFRMYIRCNVSSPDKSKLKSVRINNKKEINSTLALMQSMFMRRFMILRIQESVLYMC